MYNHLFFDLDRTLWDFESNAHETLLELVVKYQLKEKGVSSVDRFIAEYFAINEQMWEDYRKGEIDKETLRNQRFYKALLPYRIADEQLSRDLGNDYILTSPLKTKLFEDTIEVLEYLKSKYTLHIITNGFEEVQHIKLRNSGLDHYFSEVITSERAGFKKPDKRIFDFSLAAAKTKAETSIMIGDCLEADIKGAREAGLHQIYFNPSSAPHSEKITHEIKGLKELMGIL